MPQPTPLLTDTDRHLCTPFRLSRRSPSVVFRGRRDGDGTTVTRNESRLECRSDSPDEERFDWGPFRSDRWDALEFSAYESLARAMLEALLLGGGYAIDQRWSANLPSWFHNHPEFLIRFLDTPLGVNLVILPKASFEISSTDIQTWICDYFNDPDNWYSTVAQQHGLEVRDECVARHLLPLPRRVSQFSTWLLAPDPLSNPGVDSGGAAQT